MLSFLRYRIPVASNSSVRCLHPKTLGRLRRARTEVHPCKAASLYLVDFEVGLSFREQQRLTMLSHRDPIVRWARASGDGAGAQDAEITPPILDVPSTRGSRAHLLSAKRIAEVPAGVAIFFSRLRSSQEALEVIEMESDYDDPA